LFNFSGAGQVNLKFVNLTNINNTYSSGPLINAPNGVKSAIQITVNQLAFSGNCVFSSAVKGLIYIANISKNITLQSVIFDGVTIRFILFFC
jgi:hypothetical protein